MTTAITKVLTFLTLFFCVTNGYAHKLVLLTSLNPETNRPPLRFRSWNINEKLQERFYKEHLKFPVKISIEVIHFATAEDLYSALKDPEAVAIIWVGHAGFANGTGLSSLRSIVDYRGRDLKSIFQAVGPHLKYLGLVGCRGKLFLDEWQEKGYLSHVPDLKTFGREVRTDARKGLKLAMRELQSQLKANPGLLNHSKHETKAGLAYQGEGLESITIERQNRESTDMSSVQVLQKGRLIGFLPASENDQKIMVKLNTGSRTSDFKIISDSGAASSVGEINLGELLIQKDTGAYWELFKTNSGKPIGVGKHIYRYKNLN